MFSEMFKMGFDDSIEELLFKNASATGRVKDLANKVKDKLVKITKGTKRVLGKATGPARKLLPSSKAVSKNLPAAKHKDEGLLQRVKEKLSGKSSPKVMGGKGSKVNFERSIDQRLNENRNSTFRDALNRLSGKRLTTGGPRDRLSKRLSGKHEYDSSLSNIKIDRSYDSFGDRVFRTVSDSHGKLRGIKSPEEKLKELLKVKR
jgi:hypothetical protein